jgi:hypothetical protein
VSDQPLSAVGSLATGLLSAEPTPPGFAVPGAAADPFWQRFLTSAGFGGLMALTAALIAAWIATQQLRHTKSQQLNERWWNTLTWVYDRAVVEKDKRLALPHHVTFAMLTQLAERAKTPPEDMLQQSSIKSILTMFEASDDVNQSPAHRSDDGHDGDPAAAQQEENSSPPTIIQVSDPAAATLLDDLRKRLSSDDELRARAEQLQYLDAAKAVIEREAAALGADVAVIGNSGRSANVAVAWQGREVLIQIRYAKGRIPNVTVLQTIERLQREIAASYTAVGGLIVFNTPLSRLAFDTLIAAKDGTGIEVVAWTGSADDTIIRDALQRLRPATAT